MSRRGGGLARNMPENDDISPAPSRGSRRSRGNADNDDFEETRQEKRRRFDQDEDELDAGQQVVARTTGGQNSGNGSAGTIESIELVNIMCHRNLKVDLIDQVNFVTGLNGSGKSSILVAIVLGLGGKARTTMRGDSLKQLVTTGCPAGEIILRLRNKGPDAFHPEIYGDSIYIHRHINASTGSSSYKVKDAFGKTRSNESKTVHQLASHFDLDVSNPLCVLTQDQAKKFLADSTPAEKYEFFHRGTRLTDLVEEYAKIEGFINNANASIPAIRELRETKRVAHDEAQTKLKSLRVHHQLQEQIDEIRKKLVWAHVRDMEFAVAKKQRELDKAQAEVEKCQTALTRQTEKNAEYQTQKAELVEKKQQNDTAREQAMTEFQQIKAESEKWSAIGARHKSDRDSLVLRLENEQTNKVKLKEEIEKIKNADKSTKAKAIEEYEQLKQNLEAENEDLKQKIQEKHNVRAEAEKTLREIEDKQRFIIAKMERLKKQKNKLVQDLDSLTKNTNYDPVFPYGKCMRPLLTAIDRQTWRGSKPVGPVGQYVSIKDSPLYQQWISRIGDPSFSASRLVEMILGNANVLNSFVVTNDVDSRALMDLIRRVWNDNSNPEPTVITISPGRMNSNELREPNPNLLTLNRLLDIGDDAVRQTLYIRGTIEQVVLVADKREAEHLLERSHGMPQHVRSIFDRTGRFHTLRNGAFSINSLQGSKSGMSKLRESDKNAAKRRLEAEIAGVDRQILEVDVEDRQLQSEARKNQTVVVGVGKAVISFEKLIQQNKDELESAKRKIAEQDTEGEITRLTEELDNVARSIGGLELQIRDLTDTLREDRRQYDDAQTEYSRIRQALAPLQQEGKELYEQISQLTINITKAASRLAKCQEELNSATGHFERLRQELEENVQELQAQVAAGTEFCERIELSSKETSESLQRELIDKENHLRARTAIIGDPEVIEAEAISAQTAYEQVKLELHNIRQTVAEMQRAVEIRHRGYYNRRYAIILEAQSRFRETLSKRGFRGELDIRPLSENLNRGKGELSITVQPASADAARETATLSGGEKSFAQICLLLALWDSIKTRLRCLDEFDVFMDSVNRSTAMKMLAEYAQRTADVQFVFISPQESSVVAGLGSHVRCVRLDDPVRHGNQPLITNFTS